MSGIVRVAVERAAYHFDKLYSYLPPEGAELRPGCRVVVPFGRGGQRMGLVVEAEDGPAQGLKRVSRVVDPQPVLDGEMLYLLRWLKEETFCTWFDALGVLLPAGYGVRARRGYSLCRDADTPSPEDLGPLEGQILSFLGARRTPAGLEDIQDALGVEDCRKELEALESRGLVRGEEELRRRIQDQSQTMVRLAEGDPPPRLTPKQTAVMELLGQVGCGSVKEIGYFAGVGKGVIDKLANLGAVELYEEEVYRSPYPDATPREEAPAVLSPDQQAAYDALARCLEEGKPRTALLYGVTGSGKTQVFMALMDRVLARGRGVLVLVPEISLTPQAIEKFRGRYGGRVAVLHSGLSLSQRLDEWRRVKAGLADVVVGTRSAVFAPLQNLGLVVIDEEQEHTYQSESSPRFDARQAAMARVKYHGSLLVLASATPSVESYYRAARGDYALVRLKERYGAATLPDVTILDMAAQEIPAEGLSEELCQEIYNNLEQGEQSILLMNRRGHSTQVACMACHTPAQCPNCSISMKYHAANGRLMCHYCGFSQPIPQECPHCGSKFIRYAGLGTQKLEEILRQRFPTARILRMDMDTTMRKYAHQRFLDAFAAREYDILVGTQMVAKGLDFPGVTLVGVVGVDQMLYGEDFRSYERTFSLVTQVVGRSGRDRLPGRAYLQTYTPENPILRQAAAQDYEAFFREEIQSRKLHLYPPFCRFYCIGVTGEDPEKVQKTAGDILSRLTALLREEYPKLPVRLLGPSPGTVARVAGRYRYKILMKTSFSPDARRLLACLLEQAGREAPKGVAVFIAPDYDGF